MLWKLKALVASLALLALGGVAQAVPISIGSFTFDENASADTVGATTGPIRTFVVEAGGGFNLDVFSVDSVLTDNSIDSGVFCDDAPCTIELFFTDNAAVNGVGDDLILFEQGAPETTNVTIGSVERTLSVFTTQAAIVDAQGALINIYAIELDDFGIAAGGMIDTVLLDLNFPDGDPTFPGSDPTALFALNSVDAPEPGTFMLFLVGLISLAAAPSRFKAGRSRI